MNGFLLHNTIKDYCYQLLAKLQHI